MSEEDELSNLKKELSDSGKLLSELNNEITKLQKRTKYGEKSGSFYQKLIKEKNDLEKEKKSNKKDIKDYKSQIIELEKQLKSQKIEIDKLKKENEELKSKIAQKIPHGKPEPSKIRGISGLRQSLGFNLKSMKNKKLKEIKDELKEIEEYNTPGLNNEKKIEEFEKLKKAKTDNEIIFHHLQEKINNFLIKINEQNNYFENYRSYINTINIKIGSFRQKLRISIVGHDSLNLKKSSDIKVDQLIKELESISNKTYKAKEIISIAKNKTLKKGENILHDIKTKLIGIDTNKNLI